MAYTPASLEGEHRSDTADGKISITETYLGPLKPGDTVDYFCMCYREIPLDLVGHDVIVFLIYNKPMHQWENAVPRYQLFFRPELKTGILQALKEKH